MADVVSLRAYARMRGVDPKAVRKAIESGRLVRAVVRDADGHVKGVYPDVAEAEWLANTDERRRPKAHNPKPVVVRAPAESAPDDRVAPAPTTQPPRPQETATPAPPAAPQASNAMTPEQAAENPREVLTLARARLEAAKAQEAELKLAKLQSILIERAAVDVALHGAAAQVRQRLMAVPDRVVDDVITMDRTAAHARLTAEIRLALDEMVEEALREVEARTPRV